MINEFGANIRLHVIRRYTLSWGSNDRKYLFRIDLGSIRLLVPLPG